MQTSYRITPLWWMQWSIQISFDSFGRARPHAAEARLRSRSKSMNAAGTLAFCISERAFQASSWCYENADVNCRVWPFARGNRHARRAECQETDGGYLGLAITRRNWPKHYGGIKEDSANGPSRTPGFSSRGSGVATAAGMSFATIASDT
jgi:hypothetical protein